MNTNKLTKIDLKANSRKLLEWVADHLKSVLNLNIGQKEFRKIISVIAYQLKGKFFEKFISSNISGREGYLIKKDVRDFNRFNDRVRGTTDDRKYSIQHPSIWLAKNLMLNDKSLVKEFWKKLTQRKGTAFPSIPIFQKKILQKLDNFLE